jgi:hypothetical protein
MIENEPIWDAYAATLIVAEVNREACVLCGPKVAPLPSSFPVFVVTAFSPHMRYTVRNERAQAFLEHEVVSLEVPCWPAWGHFPDGSWCERSVAIARIDRPEACALGRRYGQDAIFELVRDDVRVVRCSDDQVVWVSARER